MDLRLTTAALENELGRQDQADPDSPGDHGEEPQEPPPFFEVAVLEAEPSTARSAGKKKVDIKLTKFLPSLAEVPSQGTGGPQGAGGQERLRLHRLLGGGLRLAAEDSPSTTTGRTTAPARTAA